MDANRNKRSKKAVKKTDYWLGLLQLMRLDKPVGIYLLLWPTLWSLLLSAGGLPPLSILIVFTLGVVLTRSAGCVINDYADRNVDGAVERTAQRPLVSGLIQPKHAIMLFCGLMLVAFLLVLQLNVKTILLSFVALGLATLYPFMKRYTHLPQVFLGAAFGFGIPMADMAINQSISTVTWILYFANIAWIVAYDTAYALVDREDDLKVGIKSTAILFGDHAPCIILLLQLVFVIGLAIIALMAELSLPYYLGLLAAMLTFGYQQRLLSKGDKAAFFAAFKHNNITGMCITLGVIAHYLLSR